MQNALDRNALAADDSDVSVNASGNSVTLSGRAPHLAKRDAVVGAAWMDDIIWVHDDLDITATTAAELIDRMHAGQGSSLVGSKALHKHDYIIDRPLSLHTSA